jgi:hypothetical protein
MSEFEAKTETVTESKESSEASPATPVVVTPVETATEVVTETAPTTEASSVVPAPEETNSDAKPSAIESETKETVSSFSLKIVDHA